METNHLKYDFELDLNTDNSNALIIKEITPGSSVLEFGCAHGRMTKYLTEQLGCNVYIVEKDEQCGSAASKYARFSLLGEPGDIENYTWLQLFVQQQVKFDYVVFADVLEHLYNPWKVLKATHQVLKDDGRVLMSIPNIGHNSVIIDLLNGKFDYRPVGLLDNTHIRFFTEKSIHELVTYSNYKVAKKINARNIVENTEFNNSYDDVPPEISTFLKARENGDVYQYIWSLSK